ncbi:YgaP family membrane protein [Aeromicrobium chenweiae]|uniref:DUF2892 domain-containing protein n=1 Tax=Aeromicrobium chenweiae TaxID=2079793 RepID=A0A2S0WKP0_9ACTN|nr:DUF2892 domain-containing protein [Aeromicrobium chenweiae]AWB91916.1 DUF2892 domain-containing protein [Aeromicrobium chenweiae]TGN32765.1 DUF2892 domain-containing protein [Aeromicrobium chenweiae]
MNIDRAVMALAGTLTLLGVILATLTSPWWMAVPAFVGLNLLQASLTGFCPAALILRRAGVPAGCAFRAD